MEGSSLPEKRVRKKSRRVSESPEEPPKKRKRSQRQETAGSTASNPSRKRKERDQEKHGRPKKLLVSYNFVHSGLRLSSAPLAEPKTKGASANRREYTPSNNGLNGEGGRTVELKFKNPNFTFSYLASNKKKTWKNLKQILAAERALTWRPDDPTYSSIDAPPPLKPIKKYADMSGFSAKYTDPLTGIYFNTSEEFQLIRTLPSDIVQGYLALRGKLTI